jgi:4-amino-4-deoxy-L-arabinose transferase-like glycosyltransferase
MQRLAKRLITFVHQRDWRDLWYCLGTYLVLGYAVVAAVRVYAFAFDRPVVGHHDFRQSQTALSALTIAEGGPWFAYQTPVLGAPYSIPFEFPLYQWVVAIVHVCGVPLDQAGRYVSIGFFALTLLPFYRLLRIFAFSLNVRLLTMALLISAPLYMFWTRTFMIESTALFLAVTSLAVGIEALDDLKNRKRLLLLFVVASLAMLVKGTTGVIYLGLLGLLLVGRFVLDPARRTSFPDYLRVALSGIVIPTLLGLGWTHYTDLLKSENALTANFLTSKPLHDWIYGTWQLKTAPDTWILFWERTAWFGFGTGTSLAAGLALALFGTEKPGVVAACVVSVLAAFALFTNLHWVHDYYQYATTLLAVVVMGFGYAAAERWTPRARLLLPLVGAVMLYKSLAAYNAEYRQTQVSGDVRMVDVGKFVESHTSTHALVVVFGDDWSSVVPYYARRRALTNRWNHPPTHPDMQRTLALSAAQGNHVEAVLFCHGDRNLNDGRAEAFLKHGPSCSQLADCDICL